MFEMLNGSSVHIINNIHNQVGDEFICEDGKVVRIIRKDKWFNAKGTWTINDE